MSRSNKSNASQSKPAYTLDLTACKALGKEVAAIAHDQTVQAGNIWSRILQLFSPAQAAGQGAEALEALFAPGKGKGVKAPWYRSYKSILTRALALSIVVTDGMAAKDVQRAVQDKADGAKTDAERKTAALDMLARMYAAAIGNGIKPAEIDAACKAKLAAVRLAAAPAKKAA